MIDITCPCLCYLAMAVLFTVSNGWTVHYLTMIVLLTITNGYTVHYK